MHVTLLGSYQLARASLHSQRASTYLMNECCHVCIRHVVLAVLSIVQPYLTIESTVACRDHKHRQGSSEWLISVTAVGRPGWRTQLAFCTVCWLSADAIPSGSAALLDKNLCASAN